MVVLDVLRACGLTRAQIERDAGISRATLDSWSRGTRAPTAESVNAFAAGLQKRADELVRQAERLRASVAAPGAEENPRGEM